MICILSTIIKKKKVPYETLIVVNLEISCQWFKLIITSKRMKTFNYNNQIISNRIKVEFCYLFKFLIHDWQIPIQIIFTLFKNIMILLVKWYILHMFLVRLTLLHASWQEFSFAQPSGAHLEPYLGWDQADPKTPYHVWWQRLGLSSLPLAQWTASFHGLKLVARSIQQFSPFRWISNSRTHENRGVSIAWSTRMGQQWDLHMWARMPFLVGWFELLYCHIYIFLIRKTLTFISPIYKLNVSLTLY